MEGNRILLLDMNHQCYAYIWRKIILSGYTIEYVDSVTEFFEKIKDNIYLLYIFDIVALPGNDRKWMEFDLKKRVGNWQDGPFLGLELLRSLFDPENASVYVESTTGRIFSGNALIFTAVDSKDDEIRTILDSDIQIIKKPYRESDIFEKCCDQIVTFIKDKLDPEK